MADITYEAELVDKISPALRKIQNESDKVKTSFAGLKGVLGAVTAALGVRELVNYTSSFTDLQSRLKNATGSTQDAAAAFKALSQTARTTYTSIEQTAETFLRNNQALKELGFTTQQQIEVSDALNNALAISGTKGQEAASVLNALSKAFSLGKLSGDNLNTVLASGGRITVALADGLGVTTNQLRELGAAGRLDTATMIKILRGEMEQLRREAGEMPATIRDGFVLLNNAVFNLVGQLDAVAGGSNNAGSLLANLADSLNKIATAVESSSKEIKVFIDAITNIAIIAAVTLGLTKFASVLSTIGLAAASSFGAFKQFTQAVGLGKVFTNAGTGLQTLKREVLAFPQAITRAFNPSAFKEFQDKGLKVIGSSLFSMLGGFARLIPIVGLAVGAFSLLNDTVRFITDGTSLVDFGEKAAKAIGLIGETSTEAAARIKKAEDAIAAQASQLAKARIETEQIGKATSIYVKEIAELNVQLKLSARSYEDGSKSQIKQLQNQIDLIKATDEQKKVTQNLSQVQSNYFNEQRRLGDLLSKAIRDSSSDDQKSRELAAESIKILNRQLNELFESYVVNKQIVKGLSEEENRRLTILKQQQELIKMGDVTNDYLKQNDALNKTIALEIQKIKLSEEQISVVDALYSLETQRLSAIEPLLKRIDELKRSTSEGDKTLIPIIQQGITDINSLYEKQSVILSELLDKKEKEIRLQKLSDFAADQRLKTENALRNITNETAKLGMSAIEQKYYDIAEAAKFSANEAIRLEELRRGTPLNTQEIEEYYRRSIEGTEELIAATQRMQETSRSWGMGWKKAVNEYVDDVTNGAKRAEAMFRKFTQSMEDSIVDFAKTGKFNFRNFLNSILEDLLRSQVRQLIGQIFNSGGSGRSGSAVGKILGFANGGIIPTNSPVLVGERGPEILSGAAGRVVTPNSQLGGTSVTYNINAVDAMSFKQMIASDPGFMFAVTEQGRRTVPSTRR